MTVYGSSSTGTPVRESVKTFSNSTVSAGQTGSQLMFLITLGVGTNAMIEVEAIGVRTTGGATASRYRAYVYADHKTGGTNNSLNTETAYTPTGGVGQITIGWGEQSSGVISVYLDYTKDYATKHTVRVRALGDSVVVA